MQELHPQTFTASEAEVEAYLRRLEQTQTPEGPSRLATFAGLALIAAGLLYLAQRIGAPIGWDLSGLVRALPILGGVLILLLGLGVLARPRRPRPSPDPPVAAESPPQPRRLRRSQQGKIAGVCSGIAEYFGIDPTLMRLLFVVLTLFFSGTGIPLYLVLWWIMPPASSSSARARQIPIRD
ncbi:MAG: PspC domain-containing protein [Bacteroidetes bacterium]|nr:PspC domain-containing protein [Bacteroidota bacterium]